MEVIAAVVVLLLVVAAAYGSAVLVGKWVGRSEGHEQDDGGDEEPEEKR